MSYTSFKISLFLLLSVVISYAQPINQDKSLTNQTMILNSNSILTITYVKKPWYAFRFLVVNKFKESVPEYEAIPGLLQKNYHFTEDFKLFGGIYYWHTEADAKAWFSPKWFERVLKTYGKAGEVKYYSIVKTINVKSNGNEGAFWSVLQLGEPVEISTESKGLLRVTEISSKDVKGTITLWNTKAEAKDFVRSSKGNQSTFYFDTPVLIDKIK